MKEAGNILRILEETQIAIKGEDSDKLKELSNHTIHTASTDQDPDNIVIAVIVYSISKIIERGAFREFPEFKKETLNLIKKTIDFIKKDDEKNISKSLEELRKLIEKFSGKMKEYIKDVLRKASINKASKIYEHGISQERTASLLGITMYELSGYIGQKEFDVIGKGIEVKQRIKLAMDFFNK